MTTISIRLKDSDKEELEKVCSEMEMNISTFYMIYTKKVLRDKCIPFRIEAFSDPFYSDDNLRQLEKSSDRLRSGRVVEKTLEQLEKMADE